MSSVECHDRIQPLAERKSSWNVKAPKDLLFSVLFISLSINSVQGSHLGNKTRDDSHEDEECEDEDCEHGCCDDGECCVLVSASLSVQVMVVVGAFVLTLLILLLCIVRYRCAARWNNRLRQGPAIAPGGCHQPRRFGHVYAISGNNVPTYHMERILHALSESEPRAQGEQLAPTAEQLVQPPPYCEQDPLTSPEQNAFVNLGMQKPPAYEEIVKNGGVDSGNNV